MEHIGKWAFILGLVIAAVAGLGFEQGWFYWVLALLGIVVGLMNITASETKGFLIAAIGLIVSASAVRALPYVGEVLTKVLGNVVAFISAAVLVVALKSLLEVAKD